MSPRALCAHLALAVSALFPAAAAADGPYRKIGEMELSLMGVSATLDPLTPVVPKNVVSGVRVVVRASGAELGAQEVANLLGGDFQVKADLTGPGLPGALSLPYTGPEVPPNPDPLVLLFPPLTVGGDYRLGNIHIQGPRGVMDVTPRSTTVRVIDQILITSVKTRALTLDEIREKGIVLDSDDYLGFEFTLGIKVESEPINFSFPVVFDREGVVVPQPILPPPAPLRETLGPPPLIVPLLLDAPPVVGDDGTIARPPLTVPGTNEPIRIPSVLVIPGNVGYLKQFFSAQLFVANGAPVGSNLWLRNVRGTIQLPPGQDHEPGTPDDPLSLAELATGTQPSTMDVKGVGPDGVPGTPDDPAVFGPTEQGQAEFLVRGDLEGFHTLGFDIDAVLEGLPVGPINLKGKASGGVLVRNAYLDMTFTVPSVVRAQEDFDVYATVTNIGRGVANSVDLDFDAAALSGAELIAPLPNLPIPTIQPGDSRTVKFRFRSAITGQVVASYLSFAAQPGTAGSVSGHLRFAVGIGERGVALSPDTLVLPTAVSSVPQTVVDAAMRVLGQAWSVANAPPGTLPAGVLRISKTEVYEKALALAEAGLRITLDQDEDDAVRDLVFDSLGGEDAGFDQLLRTTDAGQSLVRALGAYLHEPMTHTSGLLSYERDVVEVASSGPDFITIAVARGISAAPVDLALLDGAGRQTVAGRSAEEIPASGVPSAFFIPMGPVTTAPFLGVVARPTGSPYTLALTGRESGSVDLAVTLPRGDGAFARGVLYGANVQAGSKARVVVDLQRPDTLVYEEDLEGDGVYESQRALTRETVTSSGPNLVSANIIGPATLAGASPFGFQMALLFDRVVDPAAAANASVYEIPQNAVRSARRQLSGRLVFVLLEQPEGRLVESSVTVSEMADARGATRNGSSASLDSKVMDTGAVVTGQILNTDGTPVGSGTVYYVNQTSLVCATATHTGLAAVPIGANGAYQFRYVRQDPCGTPFKVITRDPGTSAAREVLRQVRFDGEQIVLDLVMMGRGSVGGVVKNLMGAPVAGARVAAMSQADAQSGGTATTDELGRYLIGDITVGAVNVRAVKGTSAGYATGRIDRAGTTATVDVTLDGGSVRVSGTVRVDDHVTVLPAPGAWVVYALDTAPGVNPPSPVSAVQADAFGRYAFVGMPTGRYRIEAAINTRDRASVGGIAMAGDNILGKDILIVLPEPVPTGSVHGRVVMPNGDAAPDVIVALGQAAVLTTETGDFTIAGVPVQQQAHTVSARTRDGRRFAQTTVLVTQAGQVHEAGTLTLSGLGTAVFVVWDPAGAAVAGATVRVHGAGCADPCGCEAKVTDAQGQVRYDDRPMGPVYATAMTGSGAMIDVATGSATLTQDGEPILGILRFGGFGTVSGEVLNPDGQPSHGADVGLLSMAYTNDGISTCGLTQRLTHQARTGQDGKFAFAGVHVGRVDIWASHPFFLAPVSAYSSLAHAGDNVPFTLRLVNTMSGLFRGKVFLPDGVTPAGSGIEVSATGPLPEVLVRTDANGEYRFGNTVPILPAGGYLVTARDPVTGNTARSLVYLPSGQDVTYDIRLKGRGIVRVSVVDGADVPVTAAQVRLQETEYPNRLHEGVLQPADGGALTFGGVFEGPFTVEAFDAYGSGGRVAAVLPRTGDTVGVRVRLAATGNVQGHFRTADGSAPIPYGTVRLIASGRVIGQVTTPGTGEVGSFLFEHVPQGGVRLEAEDPATGRAGFAVGAVEHQGHELTLDVRAMGLGTVRGQVTSNGVASPGVAVTVTSGAYRAATMTNDVGDYIVEGVPEGLVTVSASLDGGFLAATAQGQLVGDSVPNPQPLVLNVALRASGAITGQVLEADGATPEPRAVVSVWVGGGSAGAPQSAVVDGDGRFHFDRVAAGRADLSVHVVGSIDEAKAVAEVPPGGSVDVPLALNGVGVIVGELRDSAGQPSAGSITITGTGAFPYYLAIPVGASGSFRFPELLAGPFTVRASIPGPVTLYGMKSGTLLPDTTQNVVVQVEPSGTVIGHVVRSNGTTNAFGAEVYVVTADGDVASGYAGEDGTFTIPGVPVGGVTVKVRDPLTGERGISAGHSIPTNGATVDVGTVVLDGQGPTVTFLEPADGSSRARLAGPLRLSITDAGSGVEQGSLRVALPNGTFTAFAWNGFEAQASVDAAYLVIGENRLVAVVSDLAGNETRKEITFTVIGATVRGIVSYADGAPVVGATVQVGTATPVTSDASGAYSKSGFRPSYQYVTVTEPQHGLAVSFGVALGDGEDKEQNVAFPAMARIWGTVKHPDGTLASGVVVSRSGVQPVTTGADGAFDLGYGYVGTYALSAADPSNGDRGAVSVVLTPEGLPATITMNGVGSIAVTVKTATGAFVDNARVDVTSSSPFASPYQAFTHDGLVTFPQVLAGSITATATSTGLSGSTQGFLTDRQNLELLIQLQPAGAIEGRVFRSDGTTPAGNVRVDLTGAGTGNTTTDGDGNYAFADVPLGPFTIDATDTADGDRGRTSGNLTQVGGTVTADPIIFNGVGTVDVTVTMSQGGPVQAQVVLTTSAPLGSPKYGTSDPATGLVRFEGVLAGTITAQATSGQLHGEASGILTPGGSLPLGVTLQAVGSVTSRVVSPDGIGVEGATVYLWGMPSQQTGAGGAFSFTDVPLGSYPLTVRVGGHLRASLTITLANPGDVYDDDVVLVGMGTVAGLVTDASGTPAQGAQVLVSSQTPLYGGSLGPATTGADGRYSIADVPVGPFTISATKGGDRTDGTGSVTVHGETVTSNLQMVSSAVTLPLNLTDANALTWLVDAAGRMTHHSMLSAYGPSPVLTLVRNGVSEAFVGSGNLAASEESRREIVVRQSGLAGLDVTRKVFIPRDGYFMRYLEVLQNTGTEPVTVDVRVDTQLTTNATAYATASGDTVADATDSWLAIDDPDTEDIYLSSNGANSEFAPFAVVSQGPDGLAPSATTLSGGLLARRWNGVSIAPGQSVAFLHVFSAQADRARGEAAAQRLAQLPPEVLAGMTPSEGAAVRNFQVPADLQSAVAPLPWTDGVVWGRVLAGDGVTAVTSATVRIRSHSPYYGRPLGVWASASNGEYRIWGGWHADFYGGGDYWAVPRAPFDLTATYGDVNATFGTITKQLQGDFPSTGVIDLTSLPGRVLRFSSQELPSHLAPNAVDADLDTYWRAADGDPAPYFEVIVPSDTTVHRVRVRGPRVCPYPPGCWFQIAQARLELKNAGGAVVWSQDLTLPTPLADLDVDVTPPVPGVRSVYLTNMQPTGGRGIAELAIEGEADAGPTGHAALDVVFDNTGIAAGRVLRSDGTTVPSSRVQIWKAGAYREITADTQAGFRFLVLPPGVYDLTATHPSDVTSSAGLRVTLPVTITAGQTITQDLTFPPLGGVRGVLLSAGGAPLTGSTSLNAPGFLRSTYTSTGSYALGDVPPGTYTLRAHDNRSQVGLERTVTVEAGPYQVQDFTFPTWGRIRVEARVGQTVVQNLRVYVQADSWGPEWRDAGVTNGSGQLEYNVPGPAVRVRVTHGVTYTEVVVDPAALVTENFLAVVPVELPPMGTLTGSVKTKDGFVFAANVTYRDNQGNTSTAPNVSTYTFQSVLVGPVWLRGSVLFWHPVFGNMYTNGEVSGNVPSHGATVALDTLMPANALAVGQSDLWTLALTSGQGVDFVLLARAYGSVTALADPVLDVYRPDGTLFATYDDVSGSNKDARATFAPDATGAWIIRARGKGTDTGGYLLASFANTEAHVFREYQGAVIQGLVVKEATGLPLAQARLRLTTTRPDGGLPSASTTTTGPDGRFRLTSVPTDSSFVLELLSDAGLTLAQATGSTGAAGTVSDVSLTRPVLGRVEVLATRFGQPFAGLSIQVASTNVFAAQHLTTQSGITDSSGRLVLDPVPGGTVTAHATDPLSGGPLEATGTLTEGATLALGLVVSDGSDTTPPDAVGDLAAVSPQLGLVRLTWTAPGDDGSQGTAAAYDLRYSQSPITEAGFDSATAATAPAPLAAGTRQSVELGSLEPGVTYFFALKTRDEASNWSGLSNVATATVGSLPTAGLQLWLRADAGVTLSTGNYVAAWQDQSGHANDATQSTAAQQPLVVPGEANGLPVVRFDGADDFVRFASRLTTIRTVFWVVRETPGVPQGYRFLLGDTTTYDFCSDSTDKLWVSTYTNPAILAGETLINGVAVDGLTTARPTALSVISLTTTGSVSADSFSKDRTNTTWWGDLAELIVYDRPLTDAERVTVEAYLARRYALYAPQRRAPRIEPNGGSFPGNVTVTLVGDGAVHYTTDGGEPTEASPYYTEPFVVAPPATVKAKAFAESGGDPSPTAAVSYLSTAAFTPATLTGLRLWVRADAGGGEAGLRSASWIDQSGLGNDLGQPLVRRQPQVVPSVVNGLPAFHFDGADDWMGFATRLTGVRTVFWVIRETPGAPAGARFLLGDAMNYDFHSGGTQLWLAGTTSASILSGETRINGSLVDGTTTNRPTAMSVISLATTGPVAADSFVADRSYGRHWMGDLAELIIYDAPLTEGDRRAVEEYLAARYGITLP